MGINKREKKSGANKLKETQEQLLSLYDGTLIHTQTKHAHIFVETPPHTRERRKRRFFFKTTSI